MHTLIRDAKTTKHDFVFYADRLIRLVHLLVYVTKSFFLTADKHDVAYNGMNVRFRLWSMD